MPSNVTSFPLVSIEAAPWPAACFHPEKGILRANVLLEKLWLDSPSGEAAERRLFEDSLRQLTTQGEADSCSEGSWAHRLAFDSRGIAYLLVLFPTGDAPLVGEAGSQVAVWFPQRDYNQAVNLRSRLEETRLHLEIAVRSLESRSRVLAAMTRQMQTSLHSIDGLAAQLAHRLAAREHPAAEKLLANLLDSARGSLQQLHRIADIIENQRQEPIATGFDLREMIDELIRLNTAYLDGKQVEWIIRVHPSAQRVWNDPLYLKLVLGQLIRQAIIAAREHSRIGVQAAVCSEVGQQFLTIKICGEEKEDLPPTGSTSHPTCKDFLSALSGEIGCVPEGGCYLRLPFLSGRPDGPAPKNCTPKPVAPEQARRTVLLVDPDEFERTMLSTMLSSKETSCYELKAVSTAGQALERLGGEAGVSVLLVSLRSGALCCPDSAALLDRAAELEVPVVALLCGHSVESFAGMLGRFQGTVLRPFQPTDLYRAIERVAQV